jgi:bifunctional non-homologous end joining protein LigD
MPIAGAKRARSKTELPWIEPIRPIRRADAFDHRDWIFELKYDGFRALAYVDPENPRLMSRNRNKMTRFDSLGRAIAAELDGISAILDGEIACVDETGRPIFKDLLQKRGIPVYYAFDLLWLEGEDLRTLPLLERKSRLKKVIPPRPTWLAYVDHWVHYGKALYKEIEKEDLEGMVAKRKDASYRPDKTWYKVKNKYYTQAEGRQDLFEKYRSRGIAF